MIAAALLCAALAGAAGGEYLATGHYDITVDGLDAAEAGRMLEQLHAALARFHGGEPSCRLPVVVVRSREDWIAALREEGTGDPGGGGYYSPGTRTAYLYLQPSAYYTRQLLLHEAAHQFHWLATEGGFVRGPGWLEEGLAEYFGMHTWDGSRLVPGAVPAITLEDYPAQARRAAPSTPAKLEAMIDGGGRPGRPESWALFRFLEDRHPGSLRTFMAGIGAGNSPGASRRAAFGDDLAALAEEFGEYVLGLVQPWEIVWIAWQDLGGAIEGESETNSLAVLKETPRGLVVEVAPVTEPFKAGLAFGYSSPDSFTLLQAVSGGTVRVVRRTVGGWERLVTREGHAFGPRITMALALDGDRVTATVDGVEVGTFRAPGRIGVNTDSCRARFRVRGLAE